MTTKPEKFYKLKCVACGKYWDERKTSSHCLSCHGPLDVEYDYGYIKSRLNNYALKNAPISAAKYISFYPILDLDKLISLDEGGTPLKKSKKLSAELKIDNLYFKDETSNPTGGFKDRGSMVEVTKAMEMGAKAIINVSTGNMAASISAYASQAGIPAYVMMPEGMPLGKVAQTLAYGARVIQVRSNYTQVTRLAEEIAAKHGFYLAGDYVFRGEGQKSQAYEIAEQLYWRAPDWMIAPVGCGTNLAAIYKGFKELYTLGMIDKLPRIVGVQPEGANVVYEAYKRKSRKLKEIDKPETVCSAVAVSMPLDGLKLLNAIYESKGLAIQVPDGEALRAGKELANKESIFVEPSAALSVAGLKKMVKQKKIKPDETVVCLASGNGLKDPISMLKILPSPPSIEPSVSEVDKYLKMKLYNIQATVDQDKAEVLWRRRPTKEQVAKAAKKVFGLNLSRSYLKMLHEEVSRFFSKGKEMVRSDLQHIIEDVLKAVPDSQRLIKVEDFSVSTSKHKKAVAKVDVRIKNKRVSTDIAEGVGPVDAIMRAVRKVIKKEKLMNYWLTDFDVKIDQRGTDATVEVSMSLKDEKDNKVIATATSPDVIVAAIEAFERGYNILYNKGNGKK
ncbi:MAG: threonine synthase [Parcubacteria group bacterium]|nr:threonine synthase [Parcubacteria group bacterium]